MSFLDYFWKPFPLKYLLLFKTYMKKQTDIIKSSVLLRMFNVYWTFKNPPSEIQLRLKLGKIPDYCCSWSLNSVSLDYLISKESLKPSKAMLDLRKSSGVWYRLDYDLYTVQCNNKCIYIVIIIHDEVIRMKEIAPSF